MTELVAATRPLDGELAAPEGAGERHGVVEAAVGEGVVPVGVHRLRRIALVADRLRQQAEEGELRCRPILRRAALLAQRLDRVDGGGHAGEEPLGEGAIVRVAVDLGDEVDQLAVAVVLGHRVGAASVDAAGHLAVRVLVAREPLGERRHHVFLAEPQQCYAGERAVADPRARVGARAGLQRGSVEVDLDEREVGPHRPYEGERLVGNVDRHPVEPTAPRLLLLLAEESEPAMAVVLQRDGRPEAASRGRDRRLPDVARRQVHLRRHGGGCERRGVVDRAATAAPLRARASSRAPPRRRPRRRTPPGPAPCAPSGRRPRGPWRRRRSAGSAPRPPRC